MPELLILGLGNPLMGDDGAAAAVLERLAARGVPAGVRLEEVGTPGLALLDLWAGRERVWLVDALEMGLEAGDWRCFESLPLQRLADVRLSAHGGGLASLLRLAAELNRLPAELRLFGLQPQQLQPGAGLSPAVAAGVEGLTAELGRRLGV